MKAIIIIGALTAFIVTCTLLMTNVAEARVFEVAGPACTSSCDEYGTDVVPAFEEIATPIKRDEVKATSASVDEQIAQLMKIVRQLQAILADLKARQ